MVFAKSSPKYYGGWCVGDFILEMKLDFFLGNAVKYLCRYKNKNGLEDLRKMYTYLERVTHFPKNWKIFYPEADVALDKVTDFAESLCFTEDEFFILVGICQYSTRGDCNELTNTITLVKSLINTYISIN